MKNLRYLNSVLTVLAVLLTLNLYMQLAGAPAGSLPSVSNVARAADDDRAQGVGSTAARQQAIVDELKTLNSSVNQLQSTLTNGTLRVKVDAMPKAE